MGLLLEIALGKRGFGAAAVSGCGDEGDKRDAGDGARGGDESGVGHSDDFFRDRTASEEFEGVGTAYEEEEEAPHALPVVEALLVLVRSVSCTHSWLPGGSAPQRWALSRHWLARASLRASSWITGAPDPSCSSRDVLEARRKVTGRLEEALAACRAGTGAGAGALGSRVGARCGTVGAADARGIGISEMDMDAAMDAALVPVPSLLEALCAIGDGDQDDAPLPDDVICELVLRFVGANAPPMIDGLSWIFHQLLLPARSACLTELRNEVDMCLGRLGRPDGYVATRLPTSVATDAPRRHGEAGADSGSGGSAGGSSGGGQRQGAQGGTPAPGSMLSPTSSVLGALAGSLVKSALAAGASKAAASPRASSWAGGRETAMASAYGSRVRPMARLQATLVEAQRLYPTALTQAGPFLRVVEDDTLPDGRCVRAGTTILLHPFVTGRQEELWVNPELFEPSRFLCDAGAAPPGMGGDGADVLAAEDGSSSVADASRVSIAPTRTVAQVDHTQVFVPPEPHELPFCTGFSSAQQGQARAPVQAMAEGTHVLLHALQQAAMASVVCVVLQHSNLTLIEPDSYTYENGATLPVQGSLEVEVAHRSFRSLRLMHAIAEAEETDVTALRRHSFDQ
eukprot:g6510.t1